MPSSTKTRLAVTRSRGTGTRSESVQWCSREVDVKWQELTDVAKRLCRERENERLESIWGLIWLLAKAKCGTGERKKERGLAGVQLGQVVISCVSGRGQVADKRIRGGLNLNRALSLSPPGGWQANQAEQPRRAWSVCRGRQGRVEWVH